MPLTVERLIQAEKFGLTSQLDRCAQEVARAASALVAGLGRILKLLDIGEESQVGGNR